MKLGSNIIDIQKKNRCIVLQTLMEHPEISRVDLSHITELNKATITNIIKDFLDMGIVKDVGRISSKDGRKVAGISLCMQEVVAVILCIRKDYVSAAVCNIHGEIAHYIKVPYRDDSDIKKILKQYKQEVEKQLTYCREEGLKVLGLSVATLGWLFHEEGRFYIKADDAAVLGEVDIKGALIEMFPNMEIWVDHDANMSALAEWHKIGKKSDKMPESLLSIVGGIGFGGGIIIKGEVFGGHCGIAGEIGHMGINCLTRRHGKNTDFSGIWEDYASPLSTRDSVREHFMDYPETVLIEDCTLEQIYEAYEIGDDLAEWAMKRAARYLAYGLTSLVFILNPEVIVLGDEIIRSEKFAKQLYGYMKNFLPDELYRTLNIQFSEYDKNGILVGAGLAMVKHYLRTYQMIDFIVDTYKK